MTTKTRHPKTTKPAHPATTGGEVRVALYLRISTDEEHQPYSLEAQEHRLGAYVASQHGWILVRTFVDQASGATIERPALAQALTEARAGRYDLLLVYRVDRLARSVRGLAQILEDLEAAGAAFRSATEPFDTTTPAGRMMVQLLAVVAEFERAVIIDRVIAGMERKAARGGWVAGARPFGYRIRDSRLVPDDSEAPLVPLIFDLYAAKRLGAHAIAERLNQAGHRARSGKAWGHTAVLTVLRNRAYIGEIFFRGTWHAAEHQQLVDTEAFRQAQVVLTERGEDYSRRAANVSDYLLSGLVTCAKCGKHYTGTAATGRSATYRYYTCFSRQRYGTRTCDADRLPADELDAAVLAGLLDTYRDSRVIDRAVRAARSHANKGRRHEEAELAALDAEIAKTDATIERYLHAFEDGTMPEARAGDRVRQLGQQLNELRVARDRSATALATAPVHAPSEEQLAEVRGRVAEAIDSGPDPERKVLLQSLVHEIRVTSRDHIEPFFRVPEPSDATAVRAVYGSVGLDGLEPSTSALSVLLSWRRAWPLTWCFAVGDVAQEGSVPVPCPFASGNTGRKRFSRAIAASRSAPSLTREYSSIVRRELACPARPCITLGCTFSSTRAVMATWRSAWKVSDGSRPAR